MAIHGLAVARALARQGVDVHCLAEDESAPTAHTRYAKVHIRRGLNTDALPDVIAEVAQQIAAREKIVLFPTSDRVAKGIANAWDRLSDRFAVSWAHCRELILELQRKDSLAKYCEEAGVRHPQSRAVRTIAECEAAATALQFPLVVKPAQPLSSFKAIRITDVAQLRQLIERYPHDLPFVVQEWIEGPEPSLYSCTSYLDHGKPLYLFSSRKIAAHPPGLGQGTVFETVEDRETQTLAERFLKQLDLSGPVAVEFKRDASGAFWLIEPNVGRTEYCVDLAIQSGFNLPYLEYLHVTGRPLEAAIPQQTRSCAWFDTDKDPLCFLANLPTARDEGGRSRKLVFPFVGHDDWRPFAASVLQQSSRPFSAVGRRAVRVLRRAPA
jgi:predicted ATP-grasp superfamily ATP-dependent carboligase